jgi:hypothetical protein
MSRRKPKLAIEWSVATWKQVYFWTFTFDFVDDNGDDLPVGHDTIGARWRAIYRALTRSEKLKHENGDNLFQGIRVWEWHPGGHGIHVHVLTRYRLPVLAVRRALWKNDGYSQPDRHPGTLALCGRVHVKRIPRGAAAAYFAKTLADYLRKRGGEFGFPKGARQWCSFGLPADFKVACRQIRIDSEAKRLYDLITECRAWDVLCKAYSIPYRAKRYHRMILLQRLQKEKEPAERVREILGMRDWPVWGVPVDGDERF